MNFGMYACTYSKCVLSVFAQREVKFKWPSICTTKICPIYINKYITLCSYANSNLYICKIHDMYIVPDKFR